MKEARSLARAGYDVWHICASQEERRWDHEGVHLIALPAPTGLRARLRRLPRLYSQARALGADCYHCNEVDSWLAGLAVKATRRCKVVFDVHERYPSALAEEHFRGSASRIAAGGLRMCFALLSRFTDRFILAVPAIADDLPASSRARQVVIGNYPHAAEAAAGPASDDPDGVVAVHQGLMTRQRGWPQLLEALPRSTSQELVVHVIGAFGDDSEEDFRRRVTELGLESRVRLSGWVPPERLGAHLKSAAIGLILFQASFGAHAGSLPHKLFDYMAAALPVVAPAGVGVMSDLVREVDCGITVDTSRPSEIAAALDILAADPQVRARMGANGRRAVLATYNWEREEQKLLTLYDDLCRREI